MDAGASSSPQACRVRVQGRVQGVGYRYACTRYAREQGIAGWVRNRTDGSVEALLQGPPHALEQMCEWMRTQVPGAAVAALRVAEVLAPDPAITGFEQRPTA